MGLLDKAKAMFNKGGGTAKAKEMLDKAGGADKVEDVAAKGVGMVDDRVGDKIPDQAYAVIDKIDGKDDLPPRP